ncbi:MAG: hypothetical protein KDE19_24075 [Caldilineaceae bacterium]|nr:hypothetical protein [Caldilineaceae bacterium]
MIAFDPTHKPPALVIAVMIRNPLNRRLRRTVPALLDTGSDITAIPAKIGEELNLYPIGKYRIDGVGFASESIYSYKVILTVNDFVSDTVKVIETPLAFAVIERDLLRYFNLHMYGRAQQFELETA